MEGVNKVSQRVEPSSSNKDQEFWKRVLDTEISFIIDRPSIQETQVGDSEYRFEIHCEHCMKDRNEIPASAFCPSCVTYFCSNCLKHHERFLPSHSCLDREHMPRDICMERCPFHECEIIKFYCLTCDKVVCSECRKEHSEELCVLKYLPEYVTDKSNVTELTTLQSAGDKIAKSISSFEANIHVKHDHMGQSLTEVESAIMKRKDEMFARFDQEALKISEKVKEVNNVDEKRIQNLTKEFKLLRSKIDILLQFSRQPVAYSNSRNCKTFIELTQIKKALKQMEDSVQAVSNDIRFRDVSLNAEITRRANELKKEVEEFGKDASAERVVPAETKDQRKVAAPMKKIYIRHHSDTSDCFIVSCCLLSERYLIACDKYNRSIKLIDTLNCQLVSFRRVKTFPDAATRITDTEIAMAQPFDKNEQKSIIQFLDLTNANKLEFQRRYILTEMRCMDIKHISDGRLIVALSENHMGKIQILSHTGTVLSNFEPEYKDGYVFKCPFYLALQPGSDTVYVSDWYKDSIIEIDIVNQSNRVLDHRFWHPEGITTDNEGNIYVCESGMKRICVFHPKLSEPEVLIDADSHSDSGKPASICYSVTDRKLYVGQDGLNFMKVYRITDNSLSN